ncbi:ester cyclase [Methylomusa anaerophila]|uniref:ester cyclase n=1 Tax=Methylomusa anaerophila TaxID=1930071 RepID=UPI000F844162|nr:ester cyclase [Methylomusa anaerophila]
MKRITGMVLVAFAIIVGPLSISSAAPANGQEAEQIYMSQAPDIAQQNITIVKRFLAEVVNGGNLDIIDEFWAANMVWRGGSLGEIHGLEDYKRSMKASVGGAFTEMYLDIKDVIASGDKVVVRFTNSGNFVRPFMDIKPTYKRVEWEGIGIYKVKNQKIEEAWFSEDIMNQLLRP